MRRKKDDKRVLRAGNGRNTKKNSKFPFKRNNNQNNRRSSFKRNNNHNRQYSQRNDGYNRQHSQRNNGYNNQNKPSGKTVLIMIIVLLAFIVGAGAGIFMSFEAGNNATNATNNTTDAPHVENVTVEMTSNVNKSDDMTFDESDAVDYNENESAEILGVEDNPYYNKVEHLY